jgi:acetylornithine deacetylase
MFRTVSDGGKIRTAVRRLESRVQIEHVLEAPTVHLMTVPGYEGVVFPYTTDIPFLRAWGQPLLFGPGSIHVAHTADEFISMSELLAAVAHYRTIARQLLARLK